MGIRGKRLLKERHSLLKLKRIPLNQLQNRNAQGKKRKKSGTVSSSIPGKVITVEVEVGQEVAEGDVVLILEAMKMQNEVAAPISGTITEINCKSGENIDANLPLVVIEPLSDSENEA